MQLKVWRSSKDRAENAMCAIHNDHFICVLDYCNILGFIVAEVKKLLFLTCQLIMVEGFTYEMWLENSKNDYVSKLQLNLPTNCYYPL